MPTEEQFDAFDILKGLLDDYGLSGLSDWLWGEVVNDTPQSTIFLDLRQRPEYRARFPAMQSLGEKGYAISEDEYINNEREYERILRNAGAKPSDIQGPATFAPYFENLISPNELQNRAETLATIRNAPMTTGRMSALFRQYAQLPVNEDDLYNMLVGKDTALAEQYAQKTGTPLNVDTIQAQLRRALQEEQATFFGGGGTPATEKGIATGLLSGREEVY